MKLFFVSLSILFSFVSLAKVAGATPLTQVHGPRISDGLAVTADIGSGKGLVVVFLSAKCPCSNSHIEEMKKLAKDFSGFHFIGVHSNADESLETSKAYFAKQGLPFDVIQDEHSKIADAFKANKTPHAFLVNAAGETVYRGGVTDSSRLANASRRFLREALEDVSQNQKVRTPEGRTLGCVISRGEHYAW